MKNLLDSIKKPLRDFVRLLIRMRIHEIENADIPHSVLIFSPHQDDEMLGCGGTIIKLQKCGSKINVVFITDGCRSHKKFISEDEMTVIREEEAISSLNSLKIDNDCIHFMRLRSGKLEENYANGIQIVLEHLNRVKPEEVFIPYIRDNHHEHYLTNRIVISALAQYQNVIVVNEYPVWFWNHWPWVNIPKGRIRQRLKFFLSSLKALFFLSLDFGHYVNVISNKDLKRSALDKYKSQMTRLYPDTNWLTLNDVSNGKFLKCFFRDYEIFRRYKYIPKKTMDLSDV